MTDFADNDAVFKHKGYGEWQCVGNGHALITKGDASRPEWMRTIGNTGGSDTHTLSVEEMPAHTHSEAPFNKFGSKSSESNKENTAQSDSENMNLEYGIAQMSDEDWNKATEKSKGGNQSHNNIQLSYVVGVWRRIN